MSTGARGRKRDLRKVVGDGSEESIGDVIGAKVDMGKCRTDLFNRREERSKSAPEKVKEWDPNQEKAHLENSIETSSSRQSVGAHKSESGKGTPLSCESCEIEGNASIRSCIDDFDSRSDVKPAERNASVCVQNKWKEGDATHLIRRGHDSLRARKNSTCSSTPLPK